MVSLKFFVKEYSGVGDWLIVSDVLLDGFGRVCEGVNKYCVECSGGSLWLLEVCYDEVLGEDDLISRVRIGHGVDDLVGFFEGLGFGVVLPVGVVLF
ncbi:hypothetical protein [Methanobrevibacter sp.]|jgi:hypothetical protein|uniref:hypothetical protein n=1 Tax=Methanobrevibacter sp. TaxID=66852 RepID=UPI0038644E5C